MLYQMTFEQEMQYRGDFELRKDDDLQTVGEYLSVLNFELKIAGEWYPIDFSRLRKTHPEIHRRISVYVMACLSKVKAARVDDE